MTSPNQAGRASIEIVGDVSKLGKQLKRDAQKAVDDLDLDTSNITREIGDGFTNAAAEAADAFDDIDAHFKRTSRNLQREADDAFDGIGEAARRAGDDVEDGLVKPARAGFSQLTSVIGSLGSALVGIGSSSTNPIGLALLVAQGAALASLIPVIVTLGSALASLAGILTVLPGLIGAVIAPLILGAVAFQGFGDAISAVIEGDPEKIAEAMEKLAPAARKVVREFQELLPLFRQVGDSVQQEFFEPLVGIVEQFGEVTLPALRNELDVLAQAMGRAFGHLGGVLNETENVGILERLLASTARITDVLGASVARFADVFFEALDASLPLLEQLVGSIADGADGFTRWLRASVQDGSFQEFFQGAIDTLGELWDLAKAIGGLLGTLFTDETAEGGRDFIQTLTDLTQRMTEFFQSAEGQDAIEDFIEITQAVGSIIGYVINSIIWLIDVFTELDDAVTATGEFFSDLWDDIVSIWDGIVETIGSAIDTVVAFISEWPGRIIEYVQSIPGRVAAFFEQMIDNLLNVLAFGIALIITYFTDLPNQLIGALSALWDTISEWFGAIQDTVVQTVVDILVWFAEMPAKVEGFLSSLPGKITAFFQQAYDGVVSKLTSLVEWVKGLPGRILGALGNVGRLLFDAGKKIINGLIDGIGERIGALRQKIIDAVQMIRDHLPFSPAKTGPLAGTGSPDVAGAKIAAMIAAGLESGLPLIMEAARSSAGALADAGTPSLVTATPGQPSPVLSPTTTTASDQPVFLLEIGGEVIEAAVEKVVDRKLEVEIRRLLAGSRGI